MLRYLTVEEIKQRNILDENFCKWVDQLHEICKQQLKWKEYDVPIKLEEKTCLKSYKDDMPPYMCFRETHHE